MGAVDRYKKWSEDNPKTKLAADLTPGIGAATSVGDSAVAFNEGRHGDAALELLGVVPGVKALPMINKASRAAQKINKARQAATTADKTSDTLQYVEGRKSEDDKPDWATGGMKKGGKVRTASQRADGIAQRGKTKGRIK